MTDRCGWVGDRLPAYHAGRLDPEDRRVVEAHLAECTACAGESRLLAALRRLPVPPPPAGWEGLVEGVWEAAARERAVRRAGLGRLAPLWRAAAVIVVVVAASALWWWVGGSDDRRAAEEAPVAWEALMTSGPPWSESLIPGWFTLDDLNVVELEQLLQEVET